MDAGKQLSPGLPDMPRGQSPVKPIRLRVAILLLPLALLLACDSPSRELRMHVQTHRQFDPASLQAIFEEQSRIRIISAGERRNTSALEALTSGQADLGLVENSTAFVPGVRAVLPVFESVLHVLVRPGFTLHGKEQPLRDASFHVMNHSAAGHDFLDLITRRQGLAPDEFSVVTEMEPGVTDVIIYFGPVTPDNTGWYQPGYTLVSLANEFNPRREFYREGIGYSAPNMEPIAIPPMTYSLPGNEEVLHTLSVDTLLVTRKDVPETLIFQLTKTFLQQKPRFVAIAPHLFSGINESFDPLDLSFPLHRGARRYLRRDEPGLLERYAESINLLVYMAFLLMTGFLGLARWRAQRKKDRVDRFYVRVLALRDRAGGEEPGGLLRELDELEREAFSLLIDEKLAANESFRIFTDLVQSTRMDILKPLDLSRHC